MPLPDTKAAPEKFRGRYTRIKSFLIHYELLLEQNNVLSDKDKCELITRYCSRKVTEFIQALPSYTERKWGKLKDDMLKYYDADLDNKKYRVKDLVKLVRACKEKKLKNLSAWREYGRKFITIGGWLLKKKKISDGEYATYYWNGIPKVLRVKLENRLLAKDPVRSLASPFGVDEINGAAEALLQRDRFDMNFAGSDEEDDSDDEEGDSDESSDSESEDDLKTMRRRVRKRARFARRRASASDSEDSDDERDIRTSKRRSAKELKRKINGKEEPEVESLIKQLNTMSIDDPGYAALVFRALKLDPDVLKVVRPPVFVSRPTIPNSPQFPRSMQNIPSFQPQTPPHMGAGFQSSQTYSRNVPEDDRDKCYGCGSRAHRMGTCRELQDMMARNILVRNEVGRYVFGDGRPIRRIPGETLVNAVEREMRDRAGMKNEAGVVGSHLIRIVEPSEDVRTGDIYYTDQDSDTSESGNESESCVENVVSAAVMERFDDDEIFGFTYPVTRTERTMSAKRKEAMEAEYQQPKKRKQARAQNEESRENTRSPRPIEQRRSVPPEPRMQVPVPIVNKKEGGSREATKSGVNPRGPVPVEVRRPAYNGQDDNTIMEDVNDRQAPAKKHDAKEAAFGKTRPGEEAPVLPQVMEKFPRQSELTAQAKPLRVLNQVLNTRIDLAIGEVLGISRELSTMLGEKIKPKSTKPSGPVVASLPIATSFYTKNRGLLIRLHMQCDGRPITAIIDTGSQLNIVSKGICENKILRPVDGNQRISIADANGGQGKLEGMVANVPLNCGDVATTANLYVGTHVPFELLLGRPWQRGNFVTIDERRNGTYLLFKDPKNLEPRYEILVAVDRAPPDIYELPVWDVPDSAMLSYHISIEEAPKISESVFEGPTMSPIIPNLETHALSTSSNPSKNYRMVAPRPPFHEHSIPPKQGVNLVHPRSLTPHPDYDPNDINCLRECGKTSLEHTFYSPHSMTTAGLQYLDTEAQSGQAIQPLSRQNLFRLDSEVLLAALADAPFLRRTNNLHPLILSTADGVLLGNATDPNGHQHNDYVFLHAGLFDLSIPPYTVTPASAFVRVYPELRDGPPQPWLLPYLSNPPSEIMVSQVYPSDYSRLADRADDLILMLKQFSKTDEKVKFPTSQPNHILPLPPIKDHEAAVIGETDPAYSKLDAVSVEPFSRHHSPCATVHSTSVPIPARTSKEEISDSFSFINKPLTISTNIPRPPNPVPPTPENSSDDSSPENYSPLSTESGTTLGSNSDGYGEMDMDLEVEMEWEELKAELRKEIGVDSSGNADRSNGSKETDVVHKGTDTTELENAVKGYRVSKEIYDRLSASYCQVTGHEPSVATMSTLQAAYTTLLDRGVVAFVPREISDKSPLTIAKSHRIAGIEPPRIFSIPERSIYKHTPATSSPLVNNPPHPFLSPEPAAVFMLQNIPGSDEQMSLDDTTIIPPLSLSVNENTTEDKSTRVVINISATTPATTEPVSTDVSLSSEVEMASTTAETGSQTPRSLEDELTVTQPASPVLTATDERVNRFERSRLAGKDELIANLQLEANFLRQQMDSSEATIHQGYYERLTETIEKIRAMEAERVGELDIHYLFLAGLMYTMRQAETLSLPLPHSPPMVPTKTPQSLKESLTDAIEDFDAPEVEPYCPVRGEGGVTSYNQIDTKDIPQCPNQPPTNCDPRSIPIASRPYFQGGANDFIKKAGGVKRHLYVDLRSLSIITDPTHVPAAFLRHFTELYGNLEPFIFPGRLAPVHDWPLDVPNCKATNYQERVEELRIARRDVEAIYQSTTRALTKNQIGECLRPHITLHKRISNNSLQLSPIKVDRLYFWSRLHPNWNPLLKPIEAAFLRGAIYVYYGTGRVDKAEELERLLRTPHFDDWEVRELVSMGALDSEFRENEALTYFQNLDDEHWEFHANEEAFRNAATNILEVMDGMESNEAAGTTEETVRENDAIIVCDPCSKTNCTGFSAT